MKQKNPRCQLSPAKNPDELKLLDIKDVGLNGCDIIDSEDFKNAKLREQIWIISKEIEDNPKKFTIVGNIFNTDPSLVRRHYLKYQKDQKQIHGDNQQYTIK